MMRASPTSRCYSAHCKAAEEDGHPRTAGKGIWSKKCWQRASYTTGERWSKRQSWMKTNALLSMFHWQWQDISEFKYVSDASILFCLEHIRCRHVDVGTRCSAAVRWRHVSRSNISWRSRGQQSVWRHRVHLCLLAWFCSRRRSLCWFVLSRLLFVHFNVELLAPYCSLWLGFRCKQFAV